VHDVEVQTLLEHLADQVRRRPDAGRRVVELARVRPRERDQLLHRFHRQPGIDDQQIGGGPKRSDRCEAFDGIVVHVLVDQWADDERAGVAEEQRVTVGIRLRDGACPDGAPGARPIVDDDALPEDRRQALSDQTRHHVGRTCRRETDHDPDRPIGKRLRRCDAARGAGNRDDGAEKRRFGEHGRCSRLYPEDDA